MSILSRWLGPLVCASLACACAALWCACAASPRRYEGLGGSTRPVSTSSADAQGWFDQGLVLAWGFQHDEAVRSFEEAARLDPGCAMARWGIAYALGPNINLPLKDEAAARRAFEEAQSARALAATASDVERALIEALAQRYADPPPADRKALDAAYADAMREVARRFPADPDVGTLFELQRSESTRSISKTPWSPFSAWKVAVKRSCVASPS